MDDRKDGKDDRAPDEPIRPAADAFRAIADDIQRRLAVPLRTCAKCGETTMNGFGSCSACCERDQAAAEKQLHSIGLGPALESVKEAFRWVGFEHPKFRNTTATNRVRSVELDGIVALVGGSGAGKTTAAVARFHDELRVPLAQKRWGYGSRFVACRDIARDVMTHRIGQELGKHVRDAFSAHLLLLDDLGAETKMEPVAAQIQDIISERADSTTLVTIITTGLTPEQLEARYGDAVARRVLASKVVDLAAR